MDLCFVLKTLIFTKIIFFLDFLAQFSTIFNTIIFLILLKLRLHKQISIFILIFSSNSENQKRKFLNKTKNKKAQIVLSARSEKLQNHRGLSCPP